ncbi:hypothetical protein J1N35_015298 [Gossypium stocksii]|uniref:Uncharacterized protein n=1 Tax=Gossypium stocksii TaxID=47602 RepID=A0A9D4AAQ2_9ROSI|nr:hypothetical protein J1N35_015298 [Gossypium stocksii]
MYIFWVINLCSAYDEYQISIRFIHRIRAEQVLVGLIPLYVIMERGIRLSCSLIQFPFPLGGNQCGWFNLIISMCLTMIRRQDKIEVEFKKKLRRYQKTATYLCISEMSLYQLFTGRCWDALFL